MGMWEGCGPGKLLHKCGCPWRSTETRKQKGKPVYKQVCQEDGATWALEPFALRQKLRSDHALPPMHTCSSMNRRCLKSSQSSVSMRCLVFIVIFGKPGGGGGAETKS